MLSRFLAFLSKLIAPDPSTQQDDSTTSAPVSSSPPVAYQFIFISCRGGFFYVRERGTSNAAAEVQTYRRSSGRGLVYRCSCDRYQSDRSCDHGDELMRYLNAATPIVLCARQAPPLSHADPAPIRVQTVPSAGTNLIAGLRVGSHGFSPITLDNDQFRAIVSPDSCLPLEVSHA